jgi:hypothetical protein
MNDMMEHVHRKMLKSSGLQLARAAGKHEVLVDGSGGMERSKSGDSRENHYRH